LDALRRAANYLLDNPLLRKPLAREHISREVIQVLGG
jgi:hypothetical protein